MGRSNFIGDSGRIDSAGRRRACGAAQRVAVAARRRVHGGAAAAAGVVDGLGLSARAYHRILRVARTIVDLDESDGMREAHVFEAVQYLLMDRRVG